MDGAAAAADDDEASRRRRPAAGNASGAGRPTLLGGRLVWLCTEQRATLWKILDTAV